MRRLDEVVERSLADAQVSTERDRSLPQKRPPRSKTRRGRPAGHSPQVSHRPNRHSGYFAGNRFRIVRSPTSQGLAAGDATREAAAWRPTMPAKSRGCSLRSHLSPTGYRRLPGRGCRAFVRVSTTLAGDGPHGPLS